MMNTENTEMKDTGQGEGKQGAGETAAAILVLLILLLATARPDTRWGRPETPPATGAPDHCNPTEFFRWAEETSRWNPHAAGEQIHLFTPAGEELARMYAEGEITAEDMTSAAAQRRGAEERILPPHR